VPVVTPPPPRIEQPEIDELVEELRALIEEARRRARRRRLFVTAFVLAALAAGAAALFRGGGDGATLGRSEADASRGAAVAPQRPGRWGASRGPEGAFVTAFAAAPNAIYVGTIQSGIFKSIDRGRTWRAVGKGLTPALRVDAMAVDPARPSTVYAGSGDGIFKSTDGGRSWHRMNRGLFKPPFRDARSHRLIEGYIGSLAIDPRRPSNIYASTFFGTLASSDAGRSWHASGPLRHVTQIVFGPSDPSVVLAKEWRRSGTRVLKSTNASHTWRRLRVRFPQFGTGGVAIDAADSNTFYVAVGSLGLARSTDGGRSWQRLDGPGGTVNAFALDPARHGTIYLSSRDGLFRSTDGGGSWKRLDATLRPAEQVWLLGVDSHARGAVYGSSAGRLLRSGDGGRTWTGSTSGLRATRVTSLALASNALYAGTFGTAMFRSGDAGRTWRQLETPYIVTSVVVDPLDGHTVYAATDSSGVLKSDDDGETWRPANTGLTRHRVLALGADSSRGKLYAATGAGVFASADHARSWEPTEMTSSADSFAIGGNTAYAGAENFGVWRSAVGGTWQFRGRVCCSPVVGLAASASHPEVVYAGNFQGVMKSRDGGATWQPAGLRGVQVLALAVDPVSPQTIYAGTFRALGVYRSTNGGKTWKPFAAGLPPGGVGALAISADGRRLFAGTLGYGVVTRTLAR
jgi:photosystem II stability/assembly factor-like uncharacterized protein